MEPAIGKGAVQNAELLLFDLNFRLLSTFSVPTFESMFHLYSANISVGGGGHNPK